MDFTLLIPDVYVKIRVAIVIHTVEPSRKHYDLLCLFKFSIVVLKQSHFAAQSLLSEQTLE